MKLRETNILFDCLANTLNEHFGIETNVDVQIPILRMQVEKQVRYATYNPLAAMKKPAASGNLKNPHPSNLSKVIESDERGWLITAAFSHFCQTMRHPNPHAINHFSIEEIWRHRAVRGINDVMAQSFKSIKADMVFSLVVPYRIDRNGMDADEWKLMNSLQLREKSGNDTSPDLICSYLDISEKRKLHILYRWTDLGWFDYEDDATTGSLTEKGLSLNLKRFRTTKK